MIVFDSNQLLGEKINYDVRYAFLKVGQAEMVIDSVLHYPNGSPHYSVSFKVRTVGLLKFFYSDLLLEYESLVSSQEKSRSLTTVRKLKHGKKYSENADQFFYQDSLRINTYNLKKSRERKFSFENSDDNIRDVLGTYIWYRRVDMSEMQQSDSVKFFLAGKANNLVVDPIASSKYENSENLKFNLSFPGVPDIPQKNSHYAIISKETNALLKVKVSMDVGNFYFVRNDGK